MLYRAECDVLLVPVPLLGHNLDSAGNAASDGLELASPVRIVPLLLHGQAITPEKLALLVSLGCLLIFSLGVSGIAGRGQAPQSHTLASCRNSHGKAKKDVLNLYWMSPAVVWSNNVMPRSVDLASYSKMPKP